MKAIHLVRGSMKPTHWRLVRKMWRNGKDTAFIADYFGIKEARIYNGLAHGKGLTPYNPYRSEAKHMNIVTHRRSV